MLYLIFSNAYLAEGTLNVAVLASSPLSFERTHTYTLLQPISKEHSLCECYTWFLFSPRSDGYGVSLLVLLRWRDDTCGS